MWTEFTKVFTLFGISFFINIHFHTSGCYVLNPENSMEVFVLQLRDCHRKFRTDRGCKPVIFNIVRLSTDRWPKVSKIHKEIWWAIFWNRLKWKTQDDDERLTPMWPDLAKFYHFGIFLKSLAIFWGFNLPGIWLSFEHYWGKIFNWTKFDFLNG